MLQRSCHVNDTDMKCRFTPHCDVLTARGDVLTASGSVQRDTITYNSALSACEKGEHWQQALGIFERMRGEYVQRNTMRGEYVQSLRKRRPVAAGIGALRTFSVSVFAKALHHFTICTVDVCSETLSLTILSSVIVRKVSIGSRPWGSSKECEVSMCSETLSLTVLPSEFARKAGSGSRPWSSSQECRVKVCGDILSLAVMPSMLARKVESGSRRWAKVCSQNTIT